MILAALKRAVCSDVSQQTSHKRDDQRKNDAMKQKNHKGSIWLCFRIPLLLGLLMLAAIAQTGQSATELGSLSYLKVAAPELDSGFGRERPRFKKTTLEDSLNSIGFLNSIGGVAFAATAETNADWVVTGLSYEKERGDGKRLLIQVREKRTGQSRTADTSMPDWQFLPLVRFADSDEFSCFTYFGELLDRNEEKRILASGGHILNYHSAFSNTLLGLRLMQLDLLLLYQDSAQIVSQNGIPVKGVGEDDPDVETNKRHLVVVQKFLKAQEIQGVKFQSYVVCDQGQRVKWSVRNGQLMLTGDPIWYCWRYKPGVSERFQQVQVDANAQANVRLREEYSRRNLTETEQNVRYAQLFDEEASRRIVQPMPALTVALSARIRDENGINPLVYNAAANTMRVAAFFRMVKKECPSEWRRFVDAVGNAKTEPVVETPTVLKPSGLNRRGPVHQIRE